MMKYLQQTLVLILMCASFSGLHAQVIVGDNTKAPKPFSVLELVAQYKTGSYGGLRLPQLTTTQRNAVQTLFAGAADAEGLTIYNTTSNCVETWNGVKWLSSCAEGSVPCSISEPTATASQSFCDPGKTVANLLPAPSATIAWFSSLIDDIELGASTPLVTGTYYVAAKSGTCFSSRVAVNVTATPAWAPCTDAQASDVATITFDAQGVGCIADNRTGYSSVPNTYRVRNFGSAGTWLVENLRYAPDNTGAFTGYSFSFVKDDESVRSRYYNFPGAARNVDITTAKAAAFDVHPEYGVLYNWAAALNDANNAAFPGGAQDQVTDGSAGSAPSIKQGICPEGWVLPSDKDWTELEKELVVNPHLYSSKPDDATTWPTDAEKRVGGAYSTTFQGETGKASCGGYVNNIDPQGKSKMDGSGFNALLVGIVQSNISPVNYGGETYFWTSSANNSSSYAWGRRFHQYSKGVERVASSRYLVFSVRCKKLECSTVSAPTASDQCFSEAGKTVVDLVATPPSGATIVWYNVATGGSELATSTPLVNGTYYAASKNGSCYSSSRTAINVMTPIPWAPCTGAQASDVAAITFDAKGVGCIADNRSSGYSSVPNTYRVRQFGDAGIWLTENLRYTPQNANEGVLDGLPLNTYIAYYHYPNRDISIFNANPEYGLLYNWNSATISRFGTEANPDDDTYNKVEFKGEVESTIQGICPDGWVVPSDLDWTNLEKEIVKNPHLYSLKTAAESETWIDGEESRNDYSVTKQGETMKTSCVGKIIYDPEGKSNTDGSGFNALLVGFSNENETNSSRCQFGYNGSFWTTTSWANNSSVRRRLYSSETGVDKSPVSRSTLLSIRCKKLECSAVSAPTASDQCFSEPGKTVADLVATPPSGATIVWYNVATGGSELASSTPLVNGTYYAAAKIGGCPDYSSRVAVNVMVHIQWVSATDADVSAGKAIKDIRDNQYYRTQTFGTAGTWMIENLRYIPDNTGAFTGYSWSSADDDETIRRKYYNFPNAEIADNTEALAKAKAFNAHPEYGVLYNWAAAINDDSNVGLPAGATDLVAYLTAGHVNNNTKQGICPAGWVLPSDKDWNDLEKYVAENPRAYHTTNTQAITWDHVWDSASGYRPLQGAPTGQGLSMKTTCVNAIKGINPNGMSNTDGTGFNALLVGLQNVDYGPLNYGGYAYFWTSSSINIRIVWVRALGAGSNRTGMSRSYQERFTKFSVRCKKLESVTPTEPCDTSSLTLTSNTDTQNQIVWQPRTITRAIEPIIYKYDGEVTDVTVTGLPAGVTYSVNSSAKTVTISGLSTVYGRFPYTISAVGCGQAAVSDTIIIGCGAQTITGEWLIFMCHNLGADETLNPFVWSGTIEEDGTNELDDGIKGYLYQWGRPSDGHQLRALPNGETTTLATNNTATSPAEVVGKFILPNSLPYDWLIGGGHNDDRWGDGTQNEITMKGANDPCPNGWKIPSQKQWASIYKAETILGVPSDATANVWTWDNTGGMKIGPNVNSTTLYLPAGGYRHHRYGNGREGTARFGEYWSCTPYTTDKGYPDSYALYHENVVAVNVKAMGYRSTGKAVRCIKE